MLKYPDMPELPEVETIVRSLNREIAGRVISSWKLHFPPVLRYGEGKDLDRLVGKTIKDIRRRGKLIIMDCEGGLNLLIHLKMTGRFNFTGADVPPEKHVRFSMRLREEDRELRFHDVRKFGFLACVDDERLSSLRELRNLGPEPLELDAAGLARRLDSRRHGRLKPLLLDQSVIAGLGNIYVDEILFQSRLHPLRSADSLTPREMERLWTAMKSVLHSAIRLRGSSIRDYRDALGMEGRYQLEHQVYGRYSLPCRSCDGSIERLRISGRSSCFCPRCQPLGKPDHAD